MARERSPNYPAIDLKQALEAVTALYTKEGRTETPIEVAAKAWGYKGLSGRARSKIGALRQYGFVTQAKGKLKVSDLALTLILKGAQADYGRALKRAARTPALFGDLLDTEPEASDDGLKAYLIMDRSFTEDGANRVIQSYRATLEFANLQDASYDAGDDDADDEPETKLPPPAAGKFILPISTTESITLWGNFPITPDEWEQMNKVLQAMKPALVVAES